MYTIDDIVKSKEKQGIKIRTSMFYSWLRATGEKDVNNIMHLQNCIQIAVSECLNDRQREYLSLYLFGFSLAEISTHFKVNRSTVLRSVRRSIDRICDCVKYSTPVALTRSEKVKKQFHIYY